MNCQDVRTGLWPPERPRLLGPEVEEARAHMRQCPECARYFAQDRAILAVCHKLRLVRAPLRVRRGVFQALGSNRGGARALDRDSRAGFWRQRRSTGLAAAVLAVLIATGVILRPAGVREPVLPATAADAPGSDAAFVEDYLRRAVGEDYLESSDPEEIAHFLRRELGLQPQLLRISGLVPTRVEICLLEGRRGAMVVYRLDGRRVTHYLVPKAAESRAPQIAQEHGNLAVVTWSSAWLEEALVGEMTSERLLALARAGLTY